MQPHDDPLGPIALDLLIRSRVIDLRNGADELVSLCQPAKALASPPGRHDRCLIRRLLSALRAERRRSRRLLELLAE